MAYVIAALCVGWLVSILLQPMGYVWLRFAAEAAISTGIGMIASWRLTNALFPNRSGKWVVAAFVAAVALVSLAAPGGSPDWLQTGQALLLVGLAFGLFWPRRRLADRPGTSVSSQRQERSILGRKKQDI
ncbi:hypothetical protein [Brevundimonas guildfordensis]|uniref:Uncharacterized protein n=1 Tax=Brevundimonas guildfordensis TaxID=2762241 RepID=A0ABR8R1N6_9CAUL|nr:hypothetical protein [Brevundimonas guildfordensis]MBD7941691.1 hypothetical protein [Brevundimonas guildfordensis]